MSEIVLKKIHLKTYCLEILLFIHKCENKNDYNEKVRLTLNIDPKPNELSYK